MKRGIPTSSFLPLQLERVTLSTASMMPALHARPQLRRTILPRTRVHKGKNRKDRGVTDPGPFAKRVGCAAPIALRNRRHRIAVDECAIPHIPDARVQAGAAIEHVAPRAVGDVEEVGAFATIQLVG